MIHKFYLLLVLSLFFISVKEEKVNIIKRPSVLFGDDGSSSTRRQLASKSQFLSVPAHYSQGLSAKQDLAEPKMWEERWETSHHGSLQVQEQHHVEGVGQNHAEGTLEGCVFNEACHEPKLGPRS